MTNKVQYFPENSTLILLLKILLLFFFVGGVGALSGTEFLMHINGGTCLPGVNAGIVFLFISACLAAPTALLLRLSGPTGGKTDDMQEKTTC